MSLADAIALLAALGIGGGATAWFLLRSQIAKLRAEANRIAVETAATKGSAADAHLQTVVEFVVDPLKRRIGDLQGQADELDRQVLTLRKRSRLLIDWARAVKAWQREWHPGIQPPMPPLPPDIDDEV